MTREQYEMMLGLLNYEIGIYSRCMAIKSGPVVGSIHKQQFDLAQGAKHELSRLYFSQENASNAPSRESEQAASQAARSKICQPVRAA